MSDHTIKNCDGEVLLASQEKVFSLVKFYSCCQIFRQSDFLVALANAGDATLK